MKPAPKLCNKNVFLVIVHIYKFCVLIGLGQPIGGQNFLIYDNDEFFFLCNQTSDQHDLMMTCISKIIKLID